MEQQLRLLGHYKRVLLIGAHPDDEDTELLTVLVRGMGAAAGYLSLNRGEGGQNLIGEELGEELGLLRSEELLAARQLDGAQQAGDPQGGGAGRGSLAPPVGATRYFCPLGSG